MKDQTYREFAKEHEGVPPATLRLFFNMMAQMRAESQEAERRHKADAAEAERRHKADMAKRQKDSEEAERRHKADMAKWRKDSEEAERRHKENLAEWRKNAEAADKRHKEDMAKWQKDSEAAEERMENFRGEWGRYTDDESKMLEDQVADAIRKSGRIGKMKAESVLVNLPVRDEAQFDVFCLNGKEAMLLEVKRSLTKRDVQKFIDKMPVFAEGYPALVKGKKITGGLVFQSRSNDAANKMAFAAGLRVFQAQGEKSLKPITA